VKEKPLAKLARFETKTAPPLEGAARHWRRTVCQPVRAIAFMFSPGRGALVTKL